MIPLMNRPLAWLLGLLLTACSPTGEQVRERSSWNDDWKFALSDSVQDYSSPDSDDSTWRILSLPHDWSIEGDFSLDNPSTPGGGALPGDSQMYAVAYLPVKVEILADPRDDIISGMGEESQNVQRRVYDDVVIKMR